VAASTGNMTLAEDQTAEAFARAWASLAQGQPSSGAQGLGGPHRAQRRGVRWHRRSKETALSSHDIAAADSRGTGLDAAVLTALRRLPARQREVVVLRVFLDLDIDTTARQLGIAPGTVRAHLSRAMAALRSELAPVTTTETNDEPRREPQRQPP
jgi:RNA polymerase sigma factor (sigma-70 family)